jgi:hypothetical protein
MKAHFCPSCGGAEFCLATCRLTTAQERYYQRTIWAARVMLMSVNLLESRQYYRAQIQHAQEALRGSHQQQRAA